MDNAVKWLTSLVVDQYDYDNTFFHMVERELFLKGIIHPPSSEALVNLISQTADTLRNSHLNDTIITFAGGEKYRKLAEANPKLLYNCVVWLYILEQTILAIETDIVVQNALADKWIQKETNPPFLGYKSASKYMKLFKNDYNIESLAMNMNLMETTLTNLFSMNFSNVYDGCYLLQSTSDPSPNWVNTYWVLNLAFACKHSLNLGIICGLLFPSLIESTGKVWLQRRLLSLKMIDALSVDIHEISDANYWDLDDIEEHLQRQLKLTSRKLMKTTNLVSL
jgi:hypothetical protein